MGKYREVQCVYSYRDDNMELRGGIYNCLVISESGSISFAVKDMDQQLLVNKKILRKAIKKKRSIETDGVYIVKKDGSPILTKCKVHINIMPLVTNMYVVGLDYSIGLSNFVLEEL